MALLPGPLELTIDLLGHILSRRQLAFTFVLLFDAWCYPLNLLGKKRWFNRFFLPSGMIIENFLETPTVKNFSFVN
jgi:hypothetical protein